MLESLKNRRGFTLIELIIVVVILGILILIVLAATRGDKNKASDADVRANVARLSQALEDCYVDGTGYPVGADIAAIAADSCIAGKFDGTPPTTGVTGSSTASNYTLTGAVTSGATPIATQKQ